MPLGVQPLGWFSSCPVYAIAHDIFDAYCIVFYCGILCTFKKKKQLNCYLQFNLISSIIVKSDFIQFYYSIIFCRIK